ncbi:MAG TPA: hypothetical protein VI489_05015 [Candidatus Brocadiaceae bacterium]
MKRVEEMMRELREVVAAPIDNYFYTLARHVLIRETKARIEDLKWSLDPNDDMKNPNDPYWLIEQRISTLTATLKELERES